MFTTSMLAEAKEFAERARVESDRRCARTLTATASPIAALETAGTAFTFGMLDGRIGEGPGSVLASTALHLLAVLGDERSNLAPHAEAVAAGALVACAYRYGTRHSDGARAGRTPTDVRS